MSIPFNPHQPTSTRTRPSPPNIAFDCTNRMLPLSQPSMSTRPSLTTTHFCTGLNAGPAPVPPRTTKYSDILTRKNPRVAGPAIRTCPVPSRPLLKALRSILGDYVIIGTAKIHHCIKIIVACIV